MAHLTRVSLLFAALLALLATTGATARTPPRADPLVEVIVTLPQPSLAEAAHADRSLAAATRRRHRLDLRAPASRSYLRRLASAQRTLQARLAATIPEAHVARSYAVVLNGLAVVVPRSQLPRLRLLPGATVWPSVTYRPLLDRTPGLIGATAVWGSTLATAGEGVKIGIIDDGIDQTHPFFDPAGFAYPPGFPKGQVSYTTPKVIVARAFTRPGETYKNAFLPFDPKLSDHATHVAGIAAGDFQTVARDPNGKRVLASGVAPKAYLGNYKVLTIPTRQVGLNGNSPEIAAAVEAAVRDGMDVINLSLGEPEIEPSRDIVVKAINAAADANVVATIAAGNDFDVSGRGSIDSPAAASKAITAAASTGGRDTLADVIADFSGSGPSPLTFQMKPDVTAPGTGILSSVPRSEGSWAVIDGTSMAAPHVAGAAAVLKQRHPTWTVAQVKSALVSTGDRVRPAGGGDAEVPTTREGGGRINLARADVPLLFTDPSGISFGLAQRGRELTRTLALSDAGGGAGDWTVTIQQQSTESGVSLTAPPTATVPGPLNVTLSVDAAAEERDLTGFVVLGRGDQARRIPYWLRVTAPKLGQERRTTLARPGVYSADTRRGASLVSEYRYPDRTVGTGIPTTLAGPELVYRFTLSSPVANFGAAVVSQASGVRVQPRLVVAGDENRLVGYTGLPLTLNPYAASFHRAQPIVGAVYPGNGAYDFVFDTPTAAQAGRFTFRFWINDLTPPSVRLVGRRGTTLLVSVRDAGAGVDPSAFEATVDGRSAPFKWTGTTLRGFTGPRGPGVHRLVVSASDYQEAKNMEDVGPVLPNTRVLRTSFRVG
jgi:subtilisin family serine protease